MADQDGPACVDCLGPATVQVVSAEGVPIATYCDEDWQGAQELNAAVMKMLDDAYMRLVAEGQDQITGDLAAFKPTGLSPLLDATGAVGQHPG